MSEKRIRPKERDAIIQSLRLGVVPAIGQQHIQVGRADEVKALLKDIERIADGGSAVRFVIGEYGSGKTFFLNLIRSIALEKRLVTVHADLTPDRRIHATGGQARALYAELVRNMATRAKPGGGALASVIERFVSTALTEARDRGVSAELVIQERLDDLSEMVGGYDFAQVVSAYWKGHDSGDDRRKADAVRWMRGEFSTKTDARNALGVRTIVDDANVYDHLKLMARFVRLGGYDGLLIGLDEAVNLYKLANSQARNSNYEQILRILNDSLQGVAVGVGLLVAGTPDFMLDTRKGLYSYPALQSRLAENTFATDGLVDFSGPVLRLANLTPEDLFILLQKIRLVYGADDSHHLDLGDDALKAFMEHCSRRIGDAYFKTPRNTIVAFVNMLAVLEQNPGVAWNDLVEQVDVPSERNPDFDPLPGDDGGEAAPANAGEQDELSSFRL